jgi:hypothetical protein
VSELEGVTSVGADRAAALPLAGGQQLGLEIEVDDGFFQKEQPAAIYTAARFRANRPDDYAECVKLIGQGVAVERIKRLLHLHHQTVRAVAEREKLTVGELKEQTKRGLGEAIALAGAQAADEISRLRGLPKFIALGIMIDKKAQMDGEPNFRAEITVKGDGGKSWEEMIALREQRKARAVIDVTPPAEPEQKV